MSRFDDCLRFVFAAEGGYCDVPSDHGGATNYGITQKTYDAHRRAAGLVPQAVRLCSRIEAAAIYQMDYWRPARCGLAPSPIDLVLFDAAVNSGPHQSIKFLQRALGLNDDGIIGPVTLAALAKCNPQTVALVAIAQRRDFYKRLVERDATQAKFFNGWNNRLDKLKAEIMTPCAARGI